MTRIRLLGIALVIAILLPACGDEEPARIYIKGFGGVEVKLLVGETRDQHVALSRSPDTRLYVNVQAGTWSQFLKVTYATHENEGIEMKYEPGQSSKTVTLEGLKAGPGTVRFLIKGSSEYQELKFNVTDYTPTDQGVQPDYGAMPDISVADQGASNEASVGDMGAKEASTVADMAAKEASTAADMAATE